MCGIAGIAGFPGAAPPTAPQLGRMCETIVHRGPDDEGRDIQDSVALGMRRLSIIDVAGGRQPYFNESGTVRAVFNGEIYNFRELRRDLEKRGHRFNSAADGEVIVHLWEEHGPGFLTRLNGMFAIALHDREARTLFLARDHVGIKPLYYSALPRHLVFGSEIKAVLASGLVGRELDVDALGQFLAWEYVPSPGTLLKGVAKLEPGHALTVDLENGGHRVHSWWEIPGPERGGRAVTPEEWEERVDAKIRECVQRQLVSDVPLGAFLSGGVDSSLVVSGMGPARTFSIGFDDPSYSEIPWSERVARHLGVSHEVEVIRPAVVELFQKLMRFMDDPIGDFSIFPTFLVSQLARREVTVALSGDGGDELFGGYETYLAESMARRWSRVPRLVRSWIAEPLVRSLRPRKVKKGLVNKAKRFVEGLEHEPGLAHARWRVFAGESLRAELFTPEALAALETPVGEHVLRLREAAGERPELDRSLYVDVKSYMTDNCLVKVDRMSMACSLEARVPLLDPELVELAFRMPPELKVDRGGTKVALKRVACRHVPRECVYRPKEGFSIPIKNWLQTEFRALLETLLDPGRLAADGIFDVETVARLRREHAEGRANHSHVLWSMLVFQDWRERWSV